MNNGQFDVMETAEEIGNDKSNFIIFYVLHNLHLLEGLFSTSKKENRAFGAGMLKVLYPSEIHPD